MQSSPRVTLLLDSGWRFHLGDIPAPMPNTHIAAYMANKAGWSRGAAGRNYDDSDWRELDLPHDWSVEGAFDKDNHLDAGFLPRGVAWYRRHFQLDESDRGRHISIRFDGVATHCTVFVNGHLLHRNFCGYTPFTIDISDVVTFGEDELNVIAVRVDATYMEGWWYEGAGIYRHAWLIKTEKLRIADEGVFVRAEKLANDEWTTHVEASIENTSDESVRCEVQCELIDSHGASIGASRREIDLDLRCTRSSSHELPVRAPLLWRCDAPTLYRMRVRLVQDDEVIDEIETTFGYRTIRFDADRGFFLNDQPTKLLGTCNHQDHAGVGVALPDSIHAFRIAKLREMGSNAIRCAHNPPAPELLDACDRLGMLVMDEARNFGSSPEHLEQLRAMVRRDRNHPSVILWSICNEEAIQGTLVGEQIARTMVHAVKRLDPSRPVTAAVSGGLLNEYNIANTVDVVGINYQMPMLDAYHAKHPTRPLIAAETHSTLATRGVDRTDSAGFYFANDDSERASWGASAREVWKTVSTRDFVAGFFAWTGFDYRGEPTPHGWPCVNSQFGSLDLCGFPKALFWMNRSLFTGAVAPEAPAAGLAVALGMEIPAAAASTAPVPADGSHAIPISVFATDDHGRRVSTAGDRVTFAIEGPGIILGVGNGDPTCHEPDKASERSLFNGLAQLIVRTTNEPGTITVTASSSKLRSATLRIDATKPATERPRVVCASPRYFVRDWRMSPITADAPAEGFMPSPADMNSWERIDPSQGAQSQWLGKTGFATYLAAFTLPKTIASRGGMIRFRQIAGAAEVRWNGESIAKKANDGWDALDVPLAAVGEVKGKSVLTVLVQANGGRAGIAAPVELLPA